MATVGSQRKTDANLRLFFMQEHQRFRLANEIDAMAVSRLFKLSEGKIVVLCAAWTNDQDEIFRARRSRVRPVDEGEPRVERQLFLAP